MRRTPRRPACAPRVPPPRLPCAAAAPPPAALVGLALALWLERGGQVPQEPRPRPAVPPPSPRSASNAPPARRGASATAEVHRRLWVPLTDCHQDPPGRVCIDRRRRWCRLLKTGAARPPGPLGSSAAAARPPPTSVAPAASIPIRLWPSRRCLTRRGGGPPLCGRPGALRPRPRAPAVVRWPRPTAGAPRAPAPAGLGW